MILKSIDGGFKDAILFNAFPKLWGMIIQCNQFQTPIGETL